MRYNLSNAAALLLEVIRMDIVFGLIGATILSLGIGTIIYGVIDLYKQRGDINA